MTDAPIPLEPLEPERTPPVVEKPCPICLRPMAVDPDRCNNCGFDPAEGLQAHTGAGRKRLGKTGLTCEGCGYNLKGLPSLRCPECGTIARFKSGRDFDREMARDVTRWAYLTPLLMFGIGAAVAAALITLTDSASAAVSHFAGYIIHVPVGVLVYVACCLLWLGFGAPLHLITLRLAGIYAVVDAVWAAVNLIPVGGVLWWVVPFLLYVHLLAEHLDMEVQEAFAVAIATWFVKAGVIGLLMYLGHI